jgi:hypothetical protein
MGTSYKNASIFLGLVNFTETYTITGTTLEPLKTVGSGIG